MSKYIKSTSTYTMRKRSQGINGGAIYERDWTTLNGQKLRFGKGKTPLYTDGNFVFTTSSFQMPSRKNKTSEVIESYQYNNVKDAKSVVNNVALNTNTNDISTFAYYGSCVELVERSVMHIVASFPALLYTSNFNLEFSDEDGSMTNVTGKNGETLYVVKNDFEIDLITKSVTLSEYDNKYRYMCESYKDYEITVNGETNPITGFTVDYSFSDCDEYNQWFNFKQYREEHKDDNDGAGREAPVEIEFYVNNEKSTPLCRLLGFKVYDNIMLVCADNITIKPKNEIIEEYFDNLKGFEKQLLKRDSTPLYQNTFITPIETDNGYVYVRRNYRWPTINDYCIDISSAAYDSYVQSLLDLATLYDELKCDNLYGRMTHEAIKNFDWTYTRDYINGEEQDNIDGGLRMQQILHLIGRMFDESKQYIDGIKNCNKITYNNVNNLPEALLSDKLELHGWDVVSTIPIDEGDKDHNGYVDLTKSFLEKNKLKWYGGAGVNIINSALYDTIFMKRLLLASKKIFASKGTQEAIDMVMGMFGFGRDNESKVSDYEIQELCYKVTLNKSITREKIEKINSQRATYFDYVVDDKIDYLVNLPVNELTFKTKNEDGKREQHTFMIPFFDKNETYEHDLYFQGKGGWGRFTEDGKERGKIFNKYLESISYLNIVTNVADLFELNSVVVNPYDIYYVVSLEDYTDYYQYEEGIPVSHFFYYKEDALSASFPNSWVNLNVSIIKNSNTEVKELYDKAMYLNNIINTTFGNNPHCGFGFYDDGNEFISYMEKPFKYYLDNNELTGGLAKEADEIKFTIEEVNNRAKTLADFEYNTKYYYLNSKVVKLINKRHNDLYKRYFKNVILPYLLQVIPSTTILILQDF